jgi:hypothetical protein
MSSYLDISIERQLENGKWVNFINCSSEDALETVNLYLLRDAFRDCEYYTREVDRTDVAKQTALNFATKIQRYGGVFNSVSEGSPLWPYDKEEHDIRIETLGILSKLEELDRNENFRFCEVILTLRDGTDLTFATPYNALTELRYNPDYKDKELAHIFRDEIIIRKFFDKDGDEVVQYQVPNYTYLSTYEDLKKFEHEIERELEDAKRSQSDEVRLGSILNDEVSELKPEEMEGPLGEIVKRLIGHIGDDEWSDYTQDYIESLGNVLDELRFLIRLVGKNGRIIWRVS